MSTWRGEAGVVGESLHVLSEAAPAVYDVEREAQLVSEPLDVLVDTGRLPADVREDGAARGAVERVHTGHERQDGGLDASSQADDGQCWRGNHQRSSSSPSFGGGCVPEKGRSASTSLTWKVKSRRSLAKPCGNLYMPPSHSSKMVLP